MFLVKSQGNDKAKFYKQYTKGKEKGIEVYHHSTSLKNKGKEQEEKKNRKNLQNN